MATVMYNVCVQCVFTFNTSRLNEKQGFFARFGAKLSNTIHDELRHLKLKLSQTVTVTSG